MNEVVEQYKRSLERKERLLIPYHDKKRQSVDLTVTERTAMLILEAEIQLIKEFLEDLEYFKINTKENNEHLIKHTLEYRTINGEIGTIEEEAVTRWGAMSAALEQLKVISEDVEGLWIVNQNVEGD
jgi:hypothetical protein